MSLEDEPAMPGQRETPAPAIGSVTVEETPHFAGADPVPLLDPATAELELERAYRVRTIVGSRRPRPPWRRRVVAAALVACIVAGSAVAMVLGDTSTPHPSAVASHAGSVSPPEQKTDAGAGSPTPLPSHGRPAARRLHAPTAARRGAWRRRARGRDEHRARPGHHPRRSRPGQVRQGRTPSPDRDRKASRQPAAPANLAATPPKPPSETEDVESAPVEPAPEPTPPPEAARPEPTDTGGAKAESVPSQTPAEREFGFER